VAAGEQITIHSYRAVFDLERRIYRIDTLRLNPAGVPLRGILYAAVLALLALVVCRLGALGWPLRALPWYVRLVLAPALGGAALCVIRLEGRTFHLVLGALLTYAASPRLLCGLAAPSAPAPGSRWGPGELVALCDGSEARLRRLRYRGPGRVLVRAAHRYAPAPAWRRSRAARLVLLPADHRPRHGARSYGGGLAGRARTAPEVIAVGVGALLSVVDDARR
jgi:hypothetical protein